MHNMTSDFYEMNHNSQNNQIPLKQTKIKEKKSNEGR